MINNASLGFILEKLTDFKIRFFIISYNLNHDIIVDMRCGSLRPVYGTNEPLAGLTPEMTTHIPKIHHNLSNLANLSPYLANKLQFISFFVITWSSSRERNFLSIKKLWIKNLDCINPFKILRAGNWVYIF